MEILFLINILYGKRISNDSQGNFEFQNLADGTYYVVTVINWSVPGRYGSNSQGGGNLIQEVELKNNSTKRIILSK